MSGVPYYYTHTKRTITMDLLQIVKGFNEILWNNFLMYVLLGVGIFYTIYLGVPQIRHFGLAMKYSFGSISRRKRRRKMPVTRRTPSKRSPPPSPPRSVRVISQA